MISDQTHLPHAKEYVLYTQLNVDNYGRPLLLNVLTIYTENEKTFLMESIKLCCMSLLMLVQPVIK